jgi:tripartite-type tricarboxylate transporter receptor subunit TctC
MTKRTFLFLMIFAIALCPLSSVMSAEDYPSYPVQFIISFPPGGPGDTTIRIIHPKLQEHFGGTIQLVNKVGAGGAIAYTFVKNAKRDGYTILSTMSAPLTVGTALRTLAFSIDDYEFLGAYAFGATAIVSRLDKPWKDLDGLLAYIKDNPGKLSYGTSGAPTAPYLTVAAVLAMRDLKAEPVHYKGSAPARNAALGGHVDFSAGGFGAMQQLMRGGKLIGLAITDDERDPKFPDIPTLKEKGLGKASIGLWAGLWAPLGTPKDILNKISSALEKTIKDPAVIKNLNDAGFRVKFVLGDKAKELAKEDHETAKWIMKSIGLEKK